MSNAARRLIRQGQILPPLALTTTQGEQVSIPGNRATILVFTHPGGCPVCAGYLIEAGTVAGDLGDWATRLVAVLPAGDRLDRLPFAVTNDPDGRARSRLGIPPADAAVLLMDRWGEVFEVATFDADHDFPLPRQLVESSKIVDISCGECNVPGADWRESGE